MSFILFLFHNIYNDKPHTKCVVNYRSYRQALVELRNKSFKVKAGVLHSGIQSPLISNLFSASQELKEVSFMTRETS